MFRLVTSAAGAVALALTGLGVAGSGAGQPTAAWGAPAQAGAVATSPGIRIAVRYRLKGRKHLRAKKRAQRRRERRLRRAHGRDWAKKATGSLAVRYGGVPADTTLTSVVRGPSGYVRTLTTSRTLTGLRARTHSLSVAGFSAPVPGTARVTVSSKYSYVQSQRTASFAVRVRWTPAPGPAPKPIPTPTVTPKPRPPTSSPSPGPTPTATLTPRPTPTPPSKPTVTPAPTPTPSPSPTSIATPTEKEVLRLTNEARSRSQNCGSHGMKPAVPPLAMENRLVNAARGHAVDMATNNYFSHTGLDGRTPGDRITATGYPWRTWGENIAAGYPTPEAVVAGWIESDGHCANLMSAGFTEIGVGYAYDGSSGYRYYWVQNFGRR